MKDSALQKVSHLYDDICEDWSLAALRLTPDEMPSLARIREIYVQNNHDMEQKGVKALDEVKNRLSEVQSLMKQATLEVENFGTIIDGVSVLLDSLYEKETEAAQQLASWAGS